nr:Plant regulator RWP-RK [Ipomoea batatas]
MGSVHKVVGVKKVEQDPEAWDHSMPLPGDIIEGIAATAADNSFMQAKGWSELTLVVARIIGKADCVWLKVRRGDISVKMRVFIIPQNRSKLQKRVKIRAAYDENHVAVISELTFEECTELQEMSRRVVNMESARGFNQMPLQYDWRLKVRTYLPDPRSTVISSILFMPLPGEGRIEPTIIRTMAWFSAAVSGGIPIVFVNIQTEQINPLEGRNATRKQNSFSVFQFVQGVRLWFLPGVAEVPIELTPESGESRFGLDIRRTEEGFFCVYSVTSGTAAGRAGLGQLFEQANRTGHLLVISRLEGKSLMPSTVSSDGLIYCCDNAEIKETLSSAMERMDAVQLHFMSWPNQRSQSSPPPAFGAAALLPPS